MNLRIRKKNELPSIRNQTIERNNKVVLFWFCSKKNLYYYPSRYDSSKRDFRILCDTVGYIHLQELQD